MPLLDDQARRDILLGSTALTRGTPLGQWMEDVAVTAAGPAAGLGQETLLKSGPFLCARAGVGDQARAGMRVFLPLRATLIEITVHC